MKQKKYCQICCESPDFKVFNSFLKNSHYQTEGSERLVKYLSSRLPFSRRFLDRAIQEKGAQVNALVVKDPAYAVTQTCQIYWEGKPVPSSVPKMCVLAYHKPRKILTSHTDPWGRPCLFHHLPHNVPKGLVSVGRLDQASEGLLLLTNSGPLKRFLELPTSSFQRTYLVSVRGTLSSQHVHQAHQGLVIDGMAYRSIDLKILNGSGTQKTETCRMTLSEGKNREIRRIMAFWGLEVLKLKRISYGPFHLGALPLGQVEQLI